MDRDEITLMDPRGRILQTRLVPPGGSLAWLSVIYPDVQDEFSQYLIWIIMSLSERNTVVIPRCYLNLKIGAKCWKSMEKWNYKCLSSECFKTRPFGQRVCGPLCQWHVSIQGRDCGRKLKEGKILPFLLHIHLLEQWYNSSDVNK